MSGEVEVDETFIGGKARNMHLNERQRRITGLRERQEPSFLECWKETTHPGKVMPNRHARVCKRRLKSSKVGTALYSDEWVAYKGLETDYQHQVVDHAMKYVDGRVHTNGLENFGRS